MGITLTFESILLALGLTLVAGMSTAIGGLMAFSKTATNTRFLSGALGLSAGVMIYVAFMEMIPESLEVLKGVYADTMANIYMLIAFFGGMGLIALIDFLIPEDENPHEFHRVESAVGKAEKLKRTGFMLALAIGIHNFPEGMATFISALDGLDVAIPIVIAIAIHNIPEGIAVSIPILHATGSRRKALTYTMWTGLAEPIGAIFGIIFLLPFWTPIVSALLLAAVSGIMVFIALDELLPGAEEYGHHHYSIAGVILGMLIMAISLLIL